jgi:hypothetical protein
MWLERSSEVIEHEIGSTPAGNERRETGEEVRCAMRVTALVLVILCAATVFAKDRQWKDAKVVNITSDVGGTATVPVGTMLYGVRIVKTFYWIQTADTTYVVGPAIGKHQSLDITLYGKTRIAIDGRNAHIMDDGGKDRKLPIAEKIARTNQ